MRRCGFAELLVAGIGEDRIRDARVVLVGGAVDVARTLEAVEQARDPRSRQQDASGQVDSTQPSVRCVRAPDAGEPRRRSGSGRAWHEGRR